jgi:hypothetical protein
MARPSYLGRREGGRYFMQIKLGKPAASLYGSPILRASLGTADFTEARRRLMDSLVWAHDLVVAPDLETVGSILHARLKSYVGRPPSASERALAERCAFEHQVRHYMGRANERGYSFCKTFPGFASIWVDFVDQNKSVEQTVHRIDRHRAYEEGRNDHAQAGDAPGGRPPRLSVEASPPSHTSAIDPLQLIRALVAESLQAHATSAVAAPSQPAPAALQGAPRDAVPLTGPTMSAARDLYLAPPDRKKTHLSKGRSETVAIVQFAIHLLDDPPLRSVSKDDWDKLDLALPDIPHSRDLPADACSSLYARYCYAQKHGWDEISRVTETTIKGRYRYGLYKFIDWAIEAKLYPGPPSHLRLHRPSESGGAASRRLRRRGTARPAETAALHGMLGPSPDLDARPLRGDGTTRWSQPITKSWQYVKKVLKIERVDLTLYATRHLMADWLDNSTVAKRTRDRILGHVTDVPGGYGRKGSINANQAAISALEPEIVKQMREILMPAKDRAERAELIVLQPQSKKRTGVAKRSE